MNYEYKVLEEKFKKLPEDVQVALSSTDTSDTLKEIGDKNGLMLDQQTVMFDLTTYVLLGLVPANTFVQEFSKEANLSTDQATKIAKEINEKVLSQIRQSIRSVQETKEQSGVGDISAIEQAGQFKVEQPPAEITENPAITEADRPKILEDIENPPPATVTVVAKAPDGSHVKTEPIVDHLLANPVSLPEQKVEVKPPTPPLPPRRTTPDLYREPIN